jgi:hypothetical protein
MSLLVARGRLRLSNVAKQLPLALTNIDNLKNAVFYYLVVRYILKGWRRVVAHGPVQTVVDGWRWLSLVRGSSRFRTLRAQCAAACFTFTFTFTFTAGRPPRDALAVHPGQGGSGDRQSTSRYHHKARSPGPKDHPARLSPAPGPLRPMDRRRDGENRRRIQQHRPLEARETLRRCISYVSLTTPPGDPFQPPH